MRYLSTTALVLTCLAIPLGERASAGPDDEIQNIVVTAQKRSENLRDVPTSISALTSEDLAQQHISGIDDITRAVPGISFSAGSGSVAGAGVGAESLEIRGVGSAVGAATVGVYVDEVPVTLSTQAGTFAPKLFDLDHIEVLRGPQGTLYGASSEGGTVRFLTKQPKLDQFEAEVSGDVSGTLHGGVNTDDKAVVNLPLIDNKLALRIGAEYAFTSGWIDRYAHVPGDPTTASDDKLKSGVNSERDMVLRVAAKYAPTDDLSFTPTILYQREYQADTPAFFLNAGTYNQAKSVPEFARDVGVIPSLTIEKNLGFAQATSISSYFWRRYDRARDGTYYDSDYVVPYILDVSPTTAGQAATADQRLATLPVAAVEKERDSVFTQEIRLASPSPEQSGLPLSWVVGAYFSDSTDILHHNEQANGWNALFQSIYGFSVNDPVNSPLADPTDPTAWQDNFLYFVTKRETRQYAGFGQVDYEFLPKLHAIFGLRYQISDLSYDRVGKGFYDEGVDHDYSSTTQDFALTPKVSLSYAPSQQETLYLTAAKGYRDAGVNDPVPQSICSPYEKQIGLTGNPPNAYAPDKLWSYELGSKSLLNGNHLSINADIYYISWTGIQQQILIPTCAFDFISNVGDAKAYGSELEVLYRAPFVPGLTLGLNASTEHARITSSAGNGAAAVGDKLLYTPDWTADFSAKYYTPLSEALTGFLRGDYNWQGRSQGDFTPGTSDYTNKQYGILNASLGVITEDGLQIELYAKNLLDSVTVIREPTIAAVTEAYTVTPLTIGLKATRSF